MGVEQYSTGIGIVLLGGKNVVGILHPHRLDIGAGELAAELRRLVAVELQNINRHLRQNLFNPLGTFVNKQSHHTHKRRQHPHNRLRLLYADKAFAFFIKHQPDGIDTQFGCRLCIFRAGKTADFGAYHLISVVMIYSGLRPSR